MLETKKYGILFSSEKEKREWATAIMDAIHALAVQQTEFFIYLFIIYLFILFILILFQFYFNYFLK